ncbi:MAG: hypothetical protein U1F43_33030 [Myxococcota bacterium]
MALLLGRTDLWGEVGIPALPTQADPRLFYAQVGWVTDRLSLEAGFASFGSLSFQHGELDRAGRSIGLWAAARTASADRGAHRPGRRHLPVHHGGRHRLPRAAAKPPTELSAGR